LSSPTLAVKAVDPGLFGVVPLPAYEAFRRINAPGARD